MLKITHVKKNSRSHQKASQTTQSQNVVQNSNDYDEKILNDFQDCFKAFCIPPDVIKENYELNKEIINLKKEIQELKLLCINNSDQVIILSNQINNIKGQVYDLDSFEENKKLSLKKIRDYDSYLKKRKF